MSEASPRQRPSTATADAAALAAAAFLLSSAALIYLSLAVPGYIRRDWSAPFALSGLPCIVLGLLLLRRGHLGAVGMGVVVLFGDLAIVLSGYASADRSSTTAGALLSLPTLFTATFLPARWLPGQVALATGCAWVINVLVPADLGVHVIRTAVLVVACSCPAAIVLLLRRRLDRAVVTDPLTGLLNRRGLDIAFPALVARAGRSGLPVAVLLADVDHFKQVNDQLGHQVGDEVLRLVADATVSAVRSEDVVVRFGGEELAVALVAPEAHVRAVAQRIRREVEQMASPRQVTVSIGAAWAPAEPDATGLLDALIREADDRMYEAKRSGRNRAVFPDDAVAPAAEPDGR